AMHNRLFQKLGLDHLYLPVEVSAEDLRAVFDGLIRMNVAGFNVTIPHKVRIMELLDEVDPRAEVIGAVNTICLRDRRTLGFNTDGEGFCTSLETQLSTSIDGKRVLILGAGGAARGIGMTLAFRGAAKIYFSNRTASKAEALSAELNRGIRPCAEAIPHTSEALAKALKDCHILVNATGVGMHPEDDAMPIDGGLLFKELAVADIVYHPLMTRLLKSAKQTGCAIVKGQGMLVYQGALAFKLWTGLDPPVEEMFAALNAPTR
ncbi:MAG: shikimate dehydrogenase, partial [Desulfobacterales bacterium]